MIETLKIHDFLNQSSEGVILDVRTPAEFEKGHIPGAQNLPLFTNEERVVVGTTYIQIGKEEAIEKGLEFVGPRLAQMVKDAKVLREGKTIYLYCWRGGMRSGSVAWLLSTAGLKVKLLKGGYKAFRSDFERILTLDWDFRMLGGSTGCGKTDILKKLVKKSEQVVDIEGIANHRGSAFGSFGMGVQPSTEHFINLLHMQFRELDNNKIVWLESESMLIGHVFLPQALYKIMTSSPQIEIKMSMEQRLDRLMVDYGNFSPEMLISAFTKIRKRLGFDQVKIAIDFIEEGNIREAARVALKYYDKAYAQSSAKSQRPWRKSYTVDNDNFDKSIEEIIKLA
ncbi:MAG: tRNA 2-selenouridine(34) synthase MnmH [Rikenellaceae bacterium]